MLERNILDDNLTLSAYVLRQRLEGREPTIGLVLGSGLNPLANEIADAASIPYAEVPRMKTSTAESHVGRFVCGTLGGKCVLAMQGRLHAYEGNSAQEVAYPVWLMERLGVRTLITTNAAGALNPNYEVGDFCIMADQINFTGRGVRVREGVYLGALGPSFETPAEIRMFRSWGADTVAMSVCEEVIAARHVGMRVLGISLVSNMGCGIEGASPTGLEVLDVAKTREGDFSRLITGIVEQL